MPRWYSWVLQTTSYAQGSLRPGNSVTCRSYLLSPKTSKKKRRIVAGTASLKDIWQSLLGRPFLSGFGQAILENILGVGFRPGSGGKQAILKFLLSKNITEKGDVCCPEASYNDGSEWFLPKLHTMLWKSSQRICLHRFFRTESVPAKGLLITSPFVQCLWVHLQVWRQEYSYKGQVRSAWLFLFITLCALLPSDIPRH